GCATTTASRTAMVAATGSTAPASSVTDAAGCPTGFCRGCAGEDDEWPERFAAVAVASFSARPHWAEPALLLAQPGHQFDEIAGAVAAVELFGEDAVPAVLHRAVRAG